MRSPSCADVLSDLELADLTFGSKNWDRRRSNKASEWAVDLLEHAANHLIEDQMAEGRVYWAGALAGIELLRGAMEAVRFEATREDRSARVAASWLPKYTLARQGKADA